MSFCCADLVEMFSLTDTPITVIAGHAYLHREIQWVYLAEAEDNFLDTIQWTKGGELAIVTGSSIKGDADTALINYLRRSKKKEHRRSCHQYWQIHRRDISSRHCSR